MVYNIEGGTYKDELYAITLSLRLILLIEDKDFPWGVQLLKICLTTQGTQVQCLVWEDFTCLRASKPVCHKCKAHVLRACALQHKKPLQ